jgi:L-lactate utilization protein LutC
MTVISPFETPASVATLTAVADRLRGRNFEVVSVPNAAAARAALLERLPEGSEVHSGKSKTLEDIGIYADLAASDRYDFLRDRLFKMNRETQYREMRKLSAAPDVMLASPQAVTEEGEIVIASASGSQIGPIASGADKVLYVVGSQKIVPDLDAALRRVREHAVPRENERIQREYGKNLHTLLARILIVEAEYLSGRTTVILVNEPLGV